MKQRLDWLAKVVVLACLASSAGAALTLQEDPYAGRFMGTAKLPDGSVQITTLDLVPIERAKNAHRYLGLLKLSFGLPPSHEYVTFRFPEVRWNKETNELAFDPWEGDLNVEAVRFDAGKQRLVFEGAALGKDERVAFKLSRDGSFHDEGFVRPRLEGIYESMCPGAKHPDKLSILTSRTYGEAPLAPNPYGVYQIFGAQGRWLSDFHGRERYLTMYAISSGIHDFLTGELTLQGTQYFSCKTDIRGITCDKCLFLSKFGPPSHTQDMDWKRLSVPSPQAKPSFTPSDPKAPRDPYVGFLEHEALGISQAVELSIDLKPDAAAPGTTWRGAAHAVLLFQRSEQTPVRLSYRFAPQAFTEVPTTGATLFQVPRPFAPADAILHITHLDGSSVRGDWYSWFFGYVGSFRASRGGVNAEPKFKKTMHALDGVYDGGLYPVFFARYLVGVQSIPGRFLPRSDNPFFPVTFGGYLIVNSPGTPGIHQRFIEGALDFYTGRFNVGNFFVGDADLGHAQPKITKVDVARGSPMGFFPGYDPSGSWRWSMPFRVFRGPRDYWSRLDGR